MDKLTEERANAEYHQILDEAIREIDARTEALKAAGKYPCGLDGGNHLFKDINDKAKKRIEALKKKYGVD